MFIFSCVFTSWTGHQPLRVLGCAENGCCCPTNQKRKRQCSPGKWKRERFIEDNSKLIRWRLIELHLHQDESESHRIYCLTLSALLAVTNLSGNEMKQLYTQLCRRLPSFLWRTHVYYKTVILCKYQHMNNGNGSQGIFKAVWSFLFPTIYNVT